MGFTLEALGGLRLIGADGRVVQAQRRRLALLALLAAAGERGLTRNQLVGYLWAESDEDNAKHALNQLLYGIRRSLGESALRGADPLSLDPGIVDSDVRRFEDALSAGAFAEAASCYRGPFLNGFYLPNAPAFEYKVESERARLAAAHADVLERLAAEAERGGDAASAVAWRRTLAELDPLDARRVMSLMRALTAAGDSTGAVAHARTYEALVRGELGAPPAPAVIALAAEIKVSSARSTMTEAAPALAVRAAAPTEPEPLQRASGIGPPRDTNAPPAVASSRRRVRRALAYALGVTMLAAMLFGASEVRDRRSASHTVRPAPEQSTPMLSLANLRGDQRYTSSIEAFEWYVRGMDLALLREPGGAGQALAHFNRAVAADPSFAAAYAGIAHTHINDAGEAPGNQRQAFDLAEHAARKAVSLDDSLAEAHAALGWALQMKWDWSRAEAELKRAIALDPRATRAFEGLARGYAWTGTPAEQLSAARSGMELAPLSHSAIREMAIALSMNGRCEEAIELLRPVKSLSPTAGVAGVIRGQCYAALGEWPEAVAEFRWSLEESGARTARAFLGYALARGGQRAEANTILADLLAGRKHSHGAFGIATVYAGLKDFDKAFIWLDKAVDENSVRVYLMGPMFEDLRRDPRFARIRGRLGLQP